jgi:hypothetical protein
MARPLLTEVVLYIDSKEYNLIFKIGIVHYELSPNGCGIHILDDE